MKYDATWVIGIFNSKGEFKTRSIKQVLMERDEMSAEEADAEIAACQEDLHERLKDGKMPFDICAEWFGLEMDYIDELM